jgi:hypothetical protein
MNTTVADLSNIHLIDFDVILNNRTNCDRVDEKLGKNIKLNQHTKIRSSVDQGNDTLQSLIYRFKFTKEFMDQLYNFSKIHQYDDRKDFKEAWDIWVDENNELINDESNRLDILGYNGDIIDKMFKSARYYFRKKSDIKQEPVKRRQYIKLSKELIMLIDKHIVDNIYNEDYQPKIGFTLFCENNNEQIKEETIKIVEQGVTDKHLIQDKLKKTYKNRYFVLTNKQKKTNDIKKCNENNTLKETSS